MTKMKTRKPIELFNRMDKAISAMFGASPISNKEKQAKKERQKIDAIFERNERLSDLRMQTIINGEDEFPLLPPTQKMIANPAKVFSLISKIS